MLLLLLAQATALALLDLRGRVRTLHCATTTNAMHLSGAMEPSKSQHKDILVPEAPSIAAAYLR